jgi:hypothetical protein
MTRPTITDAALSRRLQTAAIPACRENWISKTCCGEAAATKSPRRLLPGIARAPLDNPRLPYANPRGHKALFTGIHTLPLGGFVSKDGGASPSSKHGISLYNPGEPTRMRAYFAPGSGQHGNWWRTMRIRQIQMLPGRNSLRALPGTAQSFARSAESAPIRALLIRAITKTALPQRNHGSAYAKATGGQVIRMSRMGHSSFVIRSLARRSLARRRGIPQKISPQNIPGRPQLRLARFTTGDYAGLKAIILYVKEMSL